MAPTKTIKLATLYTPLQANIAISLSNLYAFAHAVNERHFKNKRIPQEADKLQRWVASHTGLIFEPGRESFMLTTSLISRNDAHLPMLNALAPFVDTAPGNCGLEWMYSNYCTAFGILLNDSYRQQTPVARRSIDFDMQTLPDEFNPATWFQDVQSDTRITQSNPVLGHAVSTLNTYTDLEENLFVIGESTVLFESSLLNNVYCKVSTPVDNIDGLLDPIIDHLNQLGLTA